MPSQDLAINLRADESAAEAMPSERPIPLGTRVRIGFVRGFLVLYAKCFGLSGLYRMGRFFGVLEYLCDYRRRGRVHRKLISLFGDDMSPARRRAVTRRYFCRVRCDKMFYTIMDRIPRGKLLNRIKIRNGHYVDEGLSRGKGVYVALCHYGSHHVAGLMMALRGYKLAGVRDPKESHVRRYIQERYRETFPEVAAMKLVYASSFPRVIYRHMQSNAIVASLLDVDRNRGENTKTHTVTFFGQERQWLTGPVQMAIRCGATIIQGFVVSRKNFYYQLFAIPPLYEPVAGTTVDEEKIIPEVLQKYATAVEQFVREHPDHVMNI